MRSHDSSVVGQKLLRLIAAGVVDEDIDLAERLDRPLGQGVDVIAVGHVGDAMHALHIQAFRNLRRGRLQVRFMPRADGDIRARFRKTAGDRFADAFAAAGDEGGLAGKIEEGVHGRG
jgi:hypothetical protein